jgi:Arc/MetJ family transcription regulator
VTKRLVDIDDDKLERARAVLGVATIKATIDGALDELIALEARRRSLLDLEGVDLLADPDERRAAWG